MSNSSIWLIDRTLSVFTTLSQGRLVSDGNKMVLCSPQSSSITRSSPSNCLVLPKHSLWETCPSFRDATPTDWASKIQDNTRENLAYSLGSASDFIICDERERERERESEREREREEKKTKKDFCFWFLETHSKIELKLFFYVNFFDRNASNKCDENIFLFYAKAIDRQHNK